MRRERTVDQGETLFDLAPVGYLTLNEQDIVGDANLTAAHLLGVERLLLVGQPFTSFVFAADRDVHYVNRRRLQQIGEPLTWEVRLQRLGGQDGRSSFWARLEGQRQLRGDGETSSFWLTFADISEHKRDEQALLESEAMRSAAEEIAHLGSFRWEVGSRRTVWSPEMYRLFDLTPEEFDGDPAVVLETRVHPDDRALVETATATASETGEVVPLEYRVVWRDGSEHIVRGAGRTRLDADGRALGVGYYQDVTDQRRAEDEIRRLNEGLEERVLARTVQLEAVNRELEAFVYSASHDLRAPLRAIDGFSQMIIEDAVGRLDADDTEHLQRVRAAARHMGTLIDHLLTLARSARQDLLCGSVDLSSMAERLIADLRHGDPERPVEVVIQPDLVVDADLTLLDVILVNLLSNAWKFTSAHASARIEVGAVDADGERAYFVKDDGAGFDMGQAIHLFGAFQRYHSPEEFPGDGIGLAIVQRLVARHGGRVWAESEVEKGATFFFTLPPAPQPAA